MQPETIPTEEKPPPAPTGPSDLYELTPDHRLRFKFHPGQMRAWDSKRRFVVVLAGTQGGKTSYGPAHMLREVKARGPGDYLVVTPTFTLLELKALPEFRRLFESHLRLGRYVGHRFRFSEDGERAAHGQFDPHHRTTVHFGHAQDPESLESMTAKFAWLDEAGQKKFRNDSWEAINRRLTLNQGGALITTTPYNLGWLKKQLFDPWKRGDTSIDVIRFDSTENPSFPKAEFERARRLLPKWKFDLFYRAIFTRPAGCIYEAFDVAKHTCKRFNIPGDWKRYIGLDFGGVHTAAMFYAERPTDKVLFAYREYLAGGRTASEHTNYILKGEVTHPAVACGGSKSEGQWRQEFAAPRTIAGVRLPGLTIQPPLVTEVEVGIDRVIACFKQDQIMVFDDLTGYLEELETYSRVLDDVGNPTEDIEDKETFHLLDSSRYIIGRIRANTGLCKMY